MITEENKKHLVLLRQLVENYLFDELANDEEAIKVAKDILSAASLILQKAKTKEELIGAYTMISVRLAFFGYNYITYHKVDLCNILHKISLSLYDCIDVYLPNSINENELAKSLWPYDVNDIESVKHALSEYIFDNVFVFGPSYIFTHDFISKYEDKIKEAKTPREVMRVYNKIRMDALLNAWQFRETGEYDKALEYDMLNEILRFMICDFGDLLRRTG